MFNIYFKEMKKFFSLIALVAVFAACQPEKVQTAFTVAGATATINVQVFNVNTGAAYDGQYTLSASEGTVSGNTVAIESAQSTGISKHDVTLTVTGPKLAKTYTHAVTIPDVLAGGHADVSAIIVVGEDGDAYDYEIVETVVSSEETVENMNNNTHYPTHSHAGNDYYYNNSEFLLDCDIEYDVVSGVEVDMKSADFKLGFDTQVAENIMKSYNTGKSVTKASLPTFQISAYAMWRAWATYTKEVVKYTVKATNLKVTIAPRFFRDWRVCASTPSGILPVPGSMGSWPERNSVPLSSTAWE